MLKELQIVFLSSVLISININRNTGSEVRLGVDALSLVPDRFVLRSYFTCFKMPDSRSQQRYVPKQTNGITPGFSNGPERVPSSDEPLPLDKTRAMQDQIAQKSP